MPKRPHDFFTEEEWEDLERVTRRWSASGRARDAIKYPVTWDLLKALYDEERDAAEDYHRTIARILKDAAERRRN